VSGSGPSKGPAGGTGSIPRGVALPRPRVRAAGGVVWRRVPSGTEVVLVHRPAYDDWALPKGKLESQETDEQAALREVREETGLSCRLGPELPSTTYVDGEGRAKVVRYWAMTVVPGTFDVANGKLAPEPKARHEIDDLHWAPVQEARRRLTYPRDVVVLDGFCEAVVNANAPSMGASQTGASKAGASTTGVSKTGAAKTGASNARRQQVDEVLEDKPQRDKAK
jgi:8-oxo-dGTP diphosphatase